MGYVVTLLYFWLASPEMAFERVAKRVSEGGHDIPIDVIQRRYYRGIENLLNLYVPICDNWIVTSNVNVPSQVVARGGLGLGNLIINSDIWEVILKQNNDS